MKIHREYHRILDAIIKHPRYQHQVSSRLPWRLFWSRLSINHLRLILAKLEGSLKFLGDDDSEEERGPSAWIAMVWRCPSSGDDVGYMGRHFGNSDAESSQGSEAHQLGMLYVMLVRVLHLRERQAATRLAKPLPQPMRPAPRLKRRRIPSPRPASPFIYV